MYYLACANDKELHVSIHDCLIVAERWLEKTLGHIYREDLISTHCWGKIYCIPYNKLTNLSFKFLDELSYIAYIFNNTKLAAVSNDKK